jgi:hypothetical protein
MTQSDLMKKSLTKDNENFNASRSKGTVRSRRASSIKSKSRVDASIEHYLEPEMLKSHNSSALMIKKKDAALYIYRQYE